MTALKIGITGIDGFIGRNLREYLNSATDISVVSCDKEEFSDMAKLRKFVASCDVVVHLAAISRHSDGQYMYDVNMGLVHRLIEAMETEAVAPHVLFASTTHEAKDTLYHASKRDGRKLLDEWAARSGGRHTCLLMPNTFGPYGKPYYNSVVATFCRKTANGETPEIIVDAPVQLIYVRKLCSEILRVCRGETEGSSYTPAHQYEVKVSAIKDCLQNFRNGKQPDSTDAFACDLYETYQAFL